MTQCERVLRHLRDYGCIDQSTAGREYGVARLAARINDLKRRGHPIRTEMIHGVNRYDEPTKWAEYHIDKEELNA